MAGLIPWGEIDAAADVTTGAAIDRPVSRSQAAVDARIRALAPEIAAVEPDVVAAAVAAVGNAVAGLNLVPSRHDVIPEGADLNTYQTTAQVGGYRLRATATTPVLNAPVTREDGIFELWRGDGNWLSAIQRVTTPTRSMWRKGTGQSLWGPWQEVPGTVSALRREAISGGWAALFDPTDPLTIDVSANGNVTEMRDSLDQFPPMQLVSSINVAHSQAFGEFAGLNGVMQIAAIPEALRAPFTILAVVDDRSSSALQRAWVGTGASLHAGLAASGAPYMSGGTLIAFGAPLFGGPHVWEVTINGEGSEVKIDGQTFTTPVTSIGAVVSNLVIGAGRSNGGFPWGGLVGPVAIMRGDNPVAVARLRTQMMALAGIPLAEPPFGPTIRAFTVDARGNDRLAWGDPDAVGSESVASTTKILNALIVRKTINTTAKLDQVVEVSEEDEFLENAPNLKAGDRLSYRDLLASMLIPSNNTAPRTLARLVGETLPGTGSGLSRFVAAMNQELVDLGMTGAYVSDNPGGGLRCSTRQLAELMRLAMQDSVLKTLMGTANQTVTITGPAARNVEVTNAYLTIGNLTGFPAGFVAAKDGTGNIQRTLALVWEGPDGGEWVTTLLGIPMSGGARRRQIQIALSASALPEPIIRRDAPGAVAALTGQTIPATLGLMPLGQGTLSEGTDLNSLVEARNVGVWRLSGTYVNAPAGLPAAPTVSTLEVLSSGHPSSLLQRVTTTEDVFYRRMVNSSTGVWSTWRRVQSNPT